jgi:streptomycin 6-kinase
MPAVALYLPSERFLARTRALHGPPADAWLEGLPATLQRLCDEWELELDRPFDGGYGVNYVVPARRADGSAAVLKATFPNREFDSELASLTLCGGKGAVRVLASDPVAAAMLIERAVPGTMLATLAGDDARDLKLTPAVAAAMQAFWRPVPSTSCPFPSTADWGRAFARHRALYGGSGPIPAVPFDRADELFRDLLASAADSVVLHGDLHHENILSHGNGWTVIDPKGVTGEPAFEVGAYLRNPLRIWKTGDHRDLQRRRIEIFAGALGLDATRIAAWSAAQAVLSAVWDAEDGTGLSADAPWIACIETMFAVHDER